MDVWLALCPKEKQKITKRRDEREKERGGEGEGRETNRDRQTEEGPRTSIAIAQST